MVSVDTLSGEQMFNRLKEAADDPYDLVVFDEAHKLAADREPDFRVRKTDRYKLAEALAGIGSDDARWALGWHSTDLLLLTATPHMGKDYPYYFLWRLLLPEALSTFEAFNDFPAQLRAKHFIRRTKEEMVRFDGTPLYPERNCDTLSYDLSPEEQDLYHETTEYIRTYLLQPGTHPEPLGRALGDERVPAPTGELQLCIDALIRTARRETGGRDRVGARGPRGGFCKGSEETGRRRRLLRYVDR